MQSKKGKKIEYAKWESEKTGLKIGVIPPEISPDEISKEELRKFHLVFVRLKAGDVEKINGFLKMGFHISDTYLRIRGRTKPLEESTKNVEINGKVGKIRFFSDIKEAGIRKKDLIEKVLENLKDARYFRELPLEYAKKIYEAWVEEILQDGIYIIAVENNNKEKIETSGETKRTKKLCGFGGYKIVRGEKEKEKEGKFALIFAEKFLSIHIIKRFIKLGIENGVEVCEFKIRMKNTGFIKTYLNMMLKSSPQIDFEVVLSQRIKDV